MKYLNYMTFLEKIGSYAAKMSYIIRKTDNLYDFSIFSPQNKAYNLHIYIHLGRSNRKATATVPIPFPCNSGLTHRQPISYTPLSTSLHEMQLTGSPSHKITNF